jgi:hypothetical protein
MAAAGNDSLLQVSYGASSSAMASRADMCCALFAAGDVLLHTVTDAILGALSLPDIGAYMLLRLPACSLYAFARWRFCLAVDWQLGVWMGSQGGVSVAKALSYAACCGASCGVAENHILCSVGRVTAGCSMLSSWCRQTKAGWRMCCWDPGSTGAQVKVKGERSENRLVCCCVLQASCSQTMMPNGRVPPQISLSRKQ